MPHDKDDGGNGLPSNQLENYSLKNNYKLHSLLTINHILFFNSHLSFCKTIN